MQDGSEPSPIGEVARIRAEIERFLREDQLQSKVKGFAKKIAKFKPQNNEIKEAIDDLKHELSGALSPESNHAEVVSRLNAIIDHLKLPVDQAHLFCKAIDLLNDCQREIWIAKAAQDVKNLQQASHLVKFTHTQTKGASSIKSKGNPNASNLEVGTHTLGKDLELDVAIQDAKYLYVCKLVFLIVDGCSFLERAIQKDTVLARALSDDPDKAAAWMSAFAALSNPKGEPASHRLARQVYWPLEGGGYHLLAPLFSSSLSQAVHRRIQSDRFSDEAKAARKARQDKKDHPHGYRDYPDLAIQSFGGLKPQNVSQLNSERHGENYLLASLPPLWRSPAISPPLHTETVFTRYRHFGARPEVRDLAKTLRNFLWGVATRRSTFDMRETRRQLVADLCDQVLQMAAELRLLEPGWSARTDCRLNRAEQCWLDPKRSLTDNTFEKEYLRGEWKDVICKGFANWLNARLQTDKTQFGAPEAQVWRAALDDELRLLREELDDV